MNSLNHQKICVEFHVLNRHCTRYSTCPQLEHLLTSTTAANTCWYEHKIMFLFTFPRGLFHFFVHGSGLCTWILTWFTSHTCAAHFNRETSAYLQSGLGFRSNFLQPTRELFLYLLIYLFIYFTSHCSCFVPHSFWFQKYFNCQLSCWDICRPDISKTWAVL